MNKTNNNKEEYPEQEFIASCLRVGLAPKDLKEFTYIEVMKILYSFIEKEESTEVKATQKDIDLFLG